MVSERYQSFTEIDCQLVAARKMVDAKLLEHESAVWRGDQVAAERCRLEASAQLDVCFDMSERGVRALKKRGF